MHFAAKLDIFITAVSCLSFLGTLCKEKAPNVLAEETDRNHKCFLKQNATCFQSIFGGHLETWDLQRDVLKNSMSPNESSITVTFPN
jgi:hypothetical protein